MPFEKLKYLDESGFPRAVKELLNDCAQRINRDIEIKFDTTSLNPIAKVLQTEDKVTLVFPRGALGSTSALGPWALVPGLDGMVKVVGNHPLRASQNLTDVPTIINVGNEFTPAIGNLLYLDITYDATTAPTSITLVMGAPWASYPTPYILSGSGTLIDPFFVSEAFYLIGYGADPANATDLDGPVITVGITPIKVVRTCYAPLLLQFQNMGGGFIIPFPDPPSMPGPA